MDIQCLFIGQQSNLYSSLVRSLCQFDLNVRVKLVDAEKDHVLYALKKLKGAGLVFISDDVQFSLEVLSDLIWQYAPDAVAVVLTTDQSSSDNSAKTVKSANAVSSDKAISKRFSRLHFKNDSDKTQLFLQCLIQTVRFKAEFRRCKRLLGISEKRCLWLVDSSQEAIAYITKDLHLYANASYLALFNVDSTERLRSIPIQELIDGNEYLVFKQFLESQLRHCDVNRSLVISMKKTNGERFRVNIHLIPAVYKGKKCLQFWVGKVGSFKKPEEYPEINLLNEEKAKKEDAKQDKSVIQDSNSDKSQRNKDKNIIPNPFSVLKEKTAVEAETSKVDPSIILIELLKNREATLAAQKIVKLQKTEGIIDHHFLSLVVDKEQKKGVNNLLFEPQSEASLRQQVIFWDKVKFSRLFQVVRNKRKLDAFLLISLSIESATDNNFINWFLSEITKLGAKSSRLIILLPSKMKDEEKKQVFNFSKKLKSQHCKIALENYFISKSSVIILKAIRPDYVRLSIEWVKQLEGNDRHEIFLGSAIRQLESNNIKVIAPCELSSHMRKNFALSGVSFCQKKSL